MGSHEHPDRSLQIADRRLGEKVNRQDACAIKIGIPLSRRLKVSGSRFPIIKWGGWVAKV
jgi:hypothetical protein